MVLGSLFRKVGFATAASVGLSPLILKRQAATFFGVSGGGVGENNASSQYFILVFFSTWLTAASRSLSVKLGIDPIEEFINKI